MKKKWETFFMLLPLLGGCAVFYLIPFGLVVRYSLVRGSGQNEHFAGLSNYRRVIATEAFRRSFGNTLKFLAVGLPLILLLSYAIALLLWRRAEQSRLVRSVFLLPYCMPIAGTTLLLNLLFTETGLANQLLAFFGLPVADWLKAPFAFWVCILLYLWKNTGYSVMLLLSGLVTLSWEQFEAADLDGATALQKFFHLITPQMWSSVFFALTFSLINAFQSFREIFLIGGEHPDESLYMLQHFLNNGFQNLHYDRLSVASILLFLLIFVFLGAFYAFTVQKGRYRE